MKNFCLFIILLSSFIVKAQESQAIVAKKWSDDEKSYYRNLDEKELNMVKSSTDVKLKIEKGVNGDVVSIKLTGTDNDATFTHPDKTETDFVRYYFNLYNSQCLFFTSSSIIIYKLEETSDKISVKVKGCIGKKIGEKDVNNIIAFLEATKKYWVPQKWEGLADKISKVNVIPIYFDGNEELVPDEKFELGFEVEYNWGMKVKTSNLGGQYGVGNFKITSRDLTVQKAEVNYKTVYRCKPDCRYILNDSMSIEGEMAITNVKFSKKFPVKCDLDKSPAIVEARKWAGYDAISFNYTEKDKEETWTYHIKKNGFLPHGDIIAKMVYQKKNIKNMLVRVKKAGKFGLADLNGKLVIPIEYDETFVGNMADGIVSVKKGEKWGGVDLNNKVIVPFKYDKVFDFIKGMALVVVDGKTGYINKSGIEVVKPIYDQGWGFANGFAVVKKDSKYGFVSESGSVLGTVTYDDAFNFDDKGFAIVKGGQKYGVVDIKGKLVIPIEQDKMPVTLNADLIKVCKNSKFGIMNRSGKILFDYTYDEIFKCGTKTSTGSAESDKYIRVKKDGMFGFITTDGKVFRDCIFTDADDFYGSMAAITKTEDGVEKKGHLLINAEDGKGNKIANGYESLQEVEQEKSDDVATNSSNNNGGKKAVSDKKIIKNTGKNILHMGADGSTGYSINGGSSRDFPCRQKVYYTYYQNGGYNGRGPVISEAKQDCGKTINANGDQYNKK